MKYSHPRLLVNPKLAAVVLAAFISTVMWIIGSPATIRAAEGEAEVKQPKYYFVQLLGTRPGWPEEMTADEEKTMQEHFEYLKDLVRRDKVLMAGPVFEPVFGLVVLKVTSEKEARQLMDIEPSVARGVHTYELHPMHVSLLADFQAPDRYVPNPSGRILRKEVVVPASLSQVWKAWSSAAGVKTFFSPNARVELCVGGAYEIYFDMSAPEGLRGSEGCRVLNWLPEEMISFEWNAPPKFGILRTIHTRIIIQFEQVGDGAVRVTLSHVGWGEGEKWDEVYDYFDSAWTSVLNNLERRFVEGPVDWK